jgi:hypothetical protein
VNVDIDGNVSVRNSAPTIYVDGRPTTLTLDQIPADAIESVEVITNPSAKYDAAGGSGGILNIVLKKNRKTGYNGNVRAGVDKRGAMNAGGDFNLRQGKFISTQASWPARIKAFPQEIQIAQTCWIPRRHIFIRITTIKTNGGFIFGKLGLDYLVSNKTTLSLAPFACMVSSNLMRPSTSIRTAFTTPAKHPVTATGSPTVKESSMAVASFLNETHFRQEG